MKYTDYRIKNDECHLKMVKQLLGTWELSDLEHDTNSKCIDHLEFTEELGSNLDLIEAKKEAIFWLSRYFVSYLDKPLLTEHDVKTRISSAFDYRVLPVDQGDFEYMVEEGWLVLKNPLTPSAPTEHEQTLVITKQETKMSTTNKAKAIIGTAVVANRTAAATGIRLTVGKAGNKVVSKFITPKLPMVTRGVMSSTFGSLIAANVASVAVNNFMPDNAKAVAVSQAMMEAAMLEIMDSIDIEGMMDSLLEQVKGAKVDKFLKSSAEELNLEE